MQGISTSGAESKEERRKKNCHLALHVAFQGWGSSPLEAGIRKVGTGQDAAPFRSKQGRREVKET
jgi:hypothetical protein